MSEINPFKLTTIQCPRCGREVFILWNGICEACRHEKEYAKQNQELTNLIEESRKRMRHLIFVQPRKEWKLK